MDAKEALQILRDFLNKHQALKSTLEDRLSLADYDLRKKDEELARLKAERDAFKNEVEKIAFELAEAEEQNARLVEELEKETLKWVAVNDENGALLTEIERLKSLNDEALKDNGAEGNPIGEDETMPSDMTEEGDK